MRTGEGVGERGCCVLWIEACLLSCQITYDIGLIQSQGKADSYGKKIDTRYFPVYLLCLTEKVCFSPAF